MNAVLPHTESLVLSMVLAADRREFDMMRSVRAIVPPRLVAGIYLLLITAHALAATQAQQYFDQAMNAYRDGDYTHAIDGFNSAIASGMDAPAVYYNLAVCYYRAGAYARAERNFLNTARFPDMAAIAYYNLALVSLKRQDTASAVSWLEKSRQVSKDSKLDYLVASKLSKIQGAGTESSRADHAPGSKWSGVIFAGLGYDDNVTLDNTDLVLVSSQSAAVAEVFTSTQGVLSGTENDGLLFRGSLYADMNDGHNEINIAELDGGFYLADSAGRWRYEYGLSLSHSTLGGNAYLDRAGFSTSAATRLSETVGIDLRLRLRTTRSADVLYDPIEGSSQDIRVAGKWSPDSIRDLRLHYQFYNNDRNDFATATRFSSYSYTRHRLSAEYGYRITPSFRVRFATEYRLSNYKDDNIEAGGDVIRRRDDRIRLLLGLGYYRNRETLLGFRYEYVNNDSNIDRFDYISNRVLASWTRLF